MSILDWIVVGGFFTALVAAMIYVRKLNRSVADFVAANRCAGRYIICVSEGAAALGIMSFLGQFEQYYEGGFCPAFWWLMVTPMYLLITMSGWIIFRFRATRAFTYAQFYEERYSRKFRIFAGMSGFLAVLTLYGICPALFARFLINFVGVPAHILVAGINLPMFEILMVFAIIIPLLITVAGGQISVMVTDFIQGQIFQITLVVISLFLIKFVDWDDIVTVLSQGNHQGSLVNPFKSAATSDFDASFFILWIVFAMYSFGMSPATQGFQAAALNPHEAQMARVWSILRNIITVTLPFFMPIVAYVVLHHPKYSEIASHITPFITAAGNEAAQSQIRTPAVLSYILPAGLKGLFLVSALATAITTDSAFMQSLGTVFTQDILLPIRGKRFSPRTHMIILRTAMAGVGLIVFFFSMFFPQKDFLWMYMIQALGIYLAGIGVVTIGGLYWSKGSTLGAWVGMITGMTVSIGLFITRIVNKDFFLNGMECSCAAAVFATISYVVFSLIKPAKTDLKKLLNDSIDNNRSGIKLVIRSLFYLPESFKSRWDKFLGYLVRVLTITMLGTFTVLTVFNLTIRKLSDSWWFGFWKIYLSFVVIAATIFTIWLFVGGMIDMKKLIQLLKSKVRDDKDDGTVG